MLIQPEILFDLVDHLATLNLGYLGIAVTILVFLGGAFYLFNFKPLQEKIERQEKTLSELKSEVEKNLDSSKEEIKADIISFKEDYDREITDINNQRDVKVLSDIQNKIISFERDFSENFDTFATVKDEQLKTVLLSEINDNLRALEKSLSSLIESSKNETKEDIKNIQKRLASLEETCKDLKRKTRELEVFKYSQKGQMGAVYGSIDLLKDAIDENSWRIEGCIADLEKELEDVTMKPEIITKIEEQLVRLDDKPKYGPLISRIRKFYDAK